MMRGYKEQSKFNSSVRFIAGLLVVGYLFFLVGKTVYQNYQFNKDEQAIRDEIARIKERNDELLADIEYYKTDEFKELQAREKLNKQKPGETVVVITPDKSPAPKVEMRAPDPIYVKWWKYFTNRLEI